MNDRQRTVSGRLSKYQVSHPLKMQNLLTSKKGVCSHRFHQRMRILRRKTFLTWSILTEFRNGNIWSHRYTNSSQRKVIHFSIRMGLHATVSVSLRDSVLSSTHQESSQLRSMSSDHHIIYLVLLPSLNFDRRQTLKWRSKANRKTHFHHLASKWRHKSQEMTLQLNMRPDQTSSRWFEAAEHQE